MKLLINNWRLELMPTDAKEMKHWLPWIGKDMEPKECQNG